MILNEIKEKLATNKKVQIKIYSLDYTIEEQTDDIVIYANLYPKQKSFYKTIDELLNNFTIYNESIIENIDRVTILN